MSLSETLSSAEADGSKRDDRSDASDRLEVARRLLAQGDEHAVAKRYGHAEASFHRAIEHSGDFAPAYNNLGWVRQMLADAEGAERCYGQALKFDPSLRAARKIF